MDSEIIRRNVADQARRRFEQVGYADPTGACQRGMDPTRQTDLLVQRVLEQDVAEWWASQAPTHHEIPRLPTYEFASLHVCLRQIRAALSRIKVLHAGEFANDHTKEFAISNAVLSVQGLETFLSGREQNDVYIRPKTEPRN